MWAVRLLKSLFLTSHPLFMPALSHALSAEEYQKLLLDIAPGCHDLLKSFEIF